MVLFFKKEQFFFFEKKKQKTFAPHVLTGSLIGVLTHSLPMLPLAQQTRRQINGQCDDHSIEKEAEQAVDGGQAAHLA